MEQYWDMNMNIAVFIDPTMVPSESSCKLNRKLLYFERFSIFKEKK